MSRLLERQKEFVQKYGFTFRAYWATFLVLPPVAVLIAFKLKLPLIWRIALAVLVVLGQIALFSGGAALLVALFKRLIALF